MMSTLNRETALFLVRVWVEYLKREPPVLCGEVVHVVSKKKRYFFVNVDLLEFLRSVSVEQGLGDFLDDDEEIESSQ